MSAVHEGETKQQAGDNHPRTVARGREKHSLPLCLACSLTPIQPGSLSLDSARMAVQPLLPPPPLLLTVTLKR